ncbi:MAG: hypothetical protein L6Q54_14745 [Leptospiraceae bacterium]|nr:hypothetical protein [Leptospiraceae bacterium]NUM42453.1 hypothetical protein [Leptospiraceae bacterium]
MKTSTTEIEDSKKKMYDPDKALIMATPVYGGLISGIEFPYRFPYFQNGNFTSKDFQLLRGEKDLHGSGNGGGVELGIVKGNWSYVTVNFQFENTPYETVGSATNHIEKTRSSFVGTLNYLQYSWENKSQFVPTFGIGFFNGFVNTTVKDFVAFDPSQKSVIYSSYVNASSHVVNPFPKLGMKIKIPVQHWYVAPFYSYFYEEVTANVSYGTGKVLSPDPALFNPFTFAETIGNSSNNSLLYPGEARSLKKYYQNVVGANIFLDFHYFIQLRANIYRNLTRNLWTARVFLTFFFHKNIGISAYYEYAERITGHYNYWLIGPTFATQF